MLLWSYTSQLWQHPKEFSAGSPEKLAQLALFFLFWSKNNVFLGWLFGTRSDDLLDFAPNLEISHLKPEKNIETKLIKKSFSPKCSSGSVDCWFGNPDKLSGREFRIFYPVFLFCISSELKASSDCFSGQVDCSLEHFFWILDKKMISINSHVSKICTISKKTNSPQNVHWTT